MQGANTEFNNLRAEIFHYNTQKWENLFSQGEKAGSCMWITQLTYDKHLSLFCQISKYVISYTGFLTDLVNVKTLKHFSIVLSNENSCCFGLQLG